MTTLDLIYTEKSDIPVQLLTFPDGQPHLKIDVKAITHLKKELPVRILCRLKDPADILIVLFAKNTLEYLEFEHIELHISYLIAARMDRVMQEGEPFSLKVIANLINAAWFKKVRIFDPHSEVSTALIDRSYTINAHQFIKDAIEHYINSKAPASYCLVSPDAGALKKVYKLAAYLDITDIVECTKERDVRTGALTNFKTTTDNLAGKTCIIVDDICDGGGTFAGTAQMLKAKGAEKVILMVSHGIFSKGTDIDHVDMIYTTDSYKHTDSVHCYPVHKYIP